MPQRARLLLAVKAAISFALMAWLVSGIAAREGVGALFARAETLSPLALAVAVGLHFAAVLAGVARWRLLLRARGLSQPFGWLVRSFLIGRFVGAFTPSTTGLDGWRVFEVARRSGDVTGSAGVIAIEKLVGMIGMAIVCAVLAPCGVLDVLSAGGASLGVLPVAFGIAAIAIAGLVVLASPRRARRLAAIAPQAFRARVERIAEALASGELSRGRLGGAIALGIVQHLALSAVFAATAASLGVGVPIATMLAVGNAIVIAVLLPISIGGVGVREGVAVTLLAGAGVMPSDALLVALLGYLTGQIPALVGGVLLALDRDALALRREHARARTHAPATV